MKLLLAALACSLASCATVHYGRLIPLTEYERSHLSCEELDGEIEKAELFKKSTETTPGDAAVLGFLGDLGIGNAMEKEAARNSADDRIGSCNDAKREKGCPNLAPFPQEHMSIWHDSEQPQGFDVYHDNILCKIGRRIPANRVVEGKGSDSRCSTCSKLDAKK